MLRNISGTALLNNHAVTLLLDRLKHIPIKYFTQIIKQLQSLISFSWRIKHFILQSAVLHYLWIYLFQIDKERFYQCTFTNNTISLSLLIKGTNLLKRRIIRIRIMRCMKAISRHQIHKEILYIFPLSRVTTF